MSLPAVLRLGTRKSPMAKAQSGLVAEAITARTGCRVELVGVTTQGDVSKAHLAQIGGTGVFVSALRDRLLSGEVDLAVHSLKDLPTGQPAEIILAAVPRRDDPQGRAHHPGRRQARGSAGRRDHRDRLPAPGRSAPAAQEGRPLRAHPRQRGYPPGQGRDG